LATFALIHMACAGAWAWGRVPDLLRAAGHAVHAPDLDLSAGQTPASHADSVARGLAGEADVVVAGHSYGGMVVPELAARLGPRAQSLVVVDGFMPDDGDSGFAIRPPKLAELRRAQAAQRGDGLWPPPAPGPGDPEWMSRLLPMPLSAFEEPVRVTPAVASLPGTFIRCTRSDMGAQAARAQRRGWHMAEVDALHVLPLTRAETCVELLVEAAGRRRG
jgi:pimeloyl-ACP methyl ester carboxylesterase